MKHSRLASLAAVIAALAAVASLAATANAATAARGATASTKAQTVGTVQVRFAVDRFFVQKKKLYAQGETIASYAAADQTYTTSTPFTTRVTSSAARSTQAARTVQRAGRICSVLNLDIAPIHLALLGAIVDLDRVHLTITADSNGGLLGSLLCALAGNSSLATPATAAQLTSIAQTSGLASGAGFQVPVASPADATPGAQPQALPPVPNGICTVLDLPIGPLDLNLLGLMVHLDRTELRITADPNGGLLGSLLCALSGGPKTATATAVTPSTH
jgi:hypothetical protein